MANKNKSKVKTINVSEFKQWISGICDMQPKDWCPDAAQWKMIRGKIESLQDIPSQVVNNGSGWNNQSQFPRMEPEILQSGFNNQPVQQQTFLPAPTPSTPAGMTQEMLNNLAKPVDTGAPYESNFA